MPHVHKETIRREAWLIESIYCGQRAQFPSSGSIPGDAFGPNNTIDFDGESVHPGRSISLSVRQSLVEAVPFRGVILGEMIKEKPLSRKKKVTLP